MAAANSIRGTGTASIHERFPYKWIALSNTTLGILMAAINGSSLIIALPAIFRGIHVNPLAANSESLLLWVLMGYNVATTILLVAFGRISDSIGRVRLYNLGFAIFTLGSILLFLTPGKGITGEWELIIFRMVQGIGGAFLYANSTAIITDAFPPHERGLAIGLNGIAGMAGAVIGIVVGGILATVGWRYVFLINVPFGLAGTVWAYIALRELDMDRPPLHMDWLGNLTFAAGLLGVALALTYSINPHGHHATGWSSPFVLGSLIGGVVLLVAFVLIEAYVAKQPMFQLRLFRIRGFTLGNLAQFLMALSQMGLQFMIIIWLQGIWLPLHGVSYTNTPLQAGIDTLPMMVGFVVSGPLAGRISDRLGARLLGSAGLGVAAVGFVLMTTLPANFSYWTFAVYIFLLGLGMGMFAAPNSAAIMNSVPAQYRGAASGMRTTFMNTGTLLSMGLFFTLVITRLSHHLPGAMVRGLSRFPLPHALVLGIAHLPPVAALFSALLGYNPMRVLLPSTVLKLLPPPMVTTLLGKHFFPGLISAPFLTSLHEVFWIGMAMVLAGAVASALRGPRYIFDEPTGKTTWEIRRRNYLILALLAVWGARRGAKENASVAERNRLVRALTLLIAVLGDARRLEATGDGRNSERREPSQRRGF
ncbi:MAG: MFS transporter [Firmicutes bacterium]|nr:MFS transporter [Bacillota bacterium]